METNTSSMLAPGDRCSPLLSNHWGFPVAFSKLPACVFPCVHSWACESSFRRVNIPRLGRSHQAAPWEDVLEPTTSEDLPHDPPFPKRHPLMAIKLRDNWIFLI